MNWQIFHILFLLFSVKAFAGSERTYEYCFQERIRDLQSYWDLSKKSLDFNETIRDQSIRSRLSRLRLNLSVAQRECSIFEFFHNELYPVVSAKDAFLNTTFLPEIQKVHFNVGENLGLLEEIQFPQANEIPIDIELFLSLQKSAYIIWEKISLCSDGKDPRQAYAKQKFNCKNRSNNTEIKLELETLKTNINNFLMTNDVQTIAESKSLDDYICVGNDCIRNVNKNIASTELRSLFHPLFGQIILEILSRETPIFKIDSNQNLGEVNHSAMINSSVVFGLFAPYNCFSHSLWPAASRPLIESLMIGPNRESLKDFYNKITISCGTVTGRSLTTTIRKDSGAEIRRKTTTPGIYQIHSNNLMKKRNELREFIKFFRKI